LLVLFPIAVASVMVPSLRSGTRARAIVIAVAMCVVVALPIGLSSDDAMINLLMLGRAALLVACAGLISVPASAQDKPISVRAARVIDGSGKVLGDATVVVSGHQIVRVQERSAEQPDYDLGRLTLLPGLIDTHTHIETHFGRDGRASNDSESEADRALYALENAYATLMAGFTTIQSIGAPLDRELRAAIERGAPVRAY
jgi:hypothetical protein